MAKKNLSKDTPDFELALKELETIVEQMESGEQTLEQSLQDFERGMTLSKLCQENLRQAELRVENMLEKQASESSQEKDN